MAGSDSGFFDPLSVALDAYTTTPGGYIESDPSLGQIYFSSVAVPSRASTHISLLPPTGVYYGIPLPAQYQQPSELDLWMDYYTCARRYPNKMLNQWEQPSSLANEYIHESVQGVCDNNQHSADVGASQNRLGVLSCVRRRPQEISSRRCMMNGTDKGDRMQKARKAINVTSLSPGLLHSPLHLKLLEAFLQSFQYLGDIPEPAIGDIGADSLLLQTGAETWSAIHGLELGSSILLAFVEKEKGRFQCMICGKFKNSRCRALGCVRACLDYRPFVCPGRGAGCETCSDEYG
ncbi:hypothetical protein PIIN_10306 [Serendipita indica DSM 11827]|uniref:Uncharacterized protein n=1 Tax=Serendipita indica (strain DSM 11827) TaxID=1109443 RepID=G4TYB8_SERID|nr:hypothetical protein PIIN_10306 [Serendipita indica DSM 11827]